MKCKKYEITIFILFVLIVGFLTVTFLEYKNYIQMSKKVEKIYKEKEREHIIPQKVVMPFTKSDIENIVKGYLAELKGVKVVCRNIKDNSIYNLEITSENPFYKYDILAKGLTEMGKRFNVKVLYACLGVECRPPLMLTLQISPKKVNLKQEGGR